MPLWNEIEGKTLDGLPLKKLLRSEGRTAWFATDSEGQPAIVSVFEALNDEDAVQKRLQTAALVQHPNLLTIRGIGTGQLEDESLVYAVMEPFDQTLAEVLRERPLTPDETREVADSLLSGLEAVESAGLYHGHVDAAGVLAVGDAIKLRSDCLTPRHDESDAPALAALIFNALTGRRFSSERDALQLPAPFATFVRSGIGTNGSLAAMRRVLQGPATASTPAAAAGIVAQTVTPVVSTPAGSGLAKEPAARSVSPSAGIPRAALASTDDERPRRRPGVAIAALILMAIALVVFWYASPRHPRHTPINGEANTPPPTQAAQPVSESTQPATPSTQPATPAPAPTKPSARRTRQTASAIGGAGAQPAQPPAPVASANPSSEPMGERSVWHVVVYTYNRESAAQRKASELAAQYPQLEPQVFAPTDQGPYLVVLGGGMNRQDAFTRRDAARSAGLPRDTYAQNFRK